MLGFPDVLFDANYSCAPALANHSLHEMPTLSRAAVTAPSSIHDGLVTAAAAWYENPSRPRLLTAVAEQWTVLLDEWIAAKDVPLIVRRPRNNRGHLLSHTSGRDIIPADNSPAHWSLSCAFSGCCPSLNEVRSMLSSDQIPIAMVIKAEENVGARYRCTRQAIQGPNQLGWKVAHIEDVGLGYAGALESTSLEILGAHMKRFLSPENMFLVPKKYAGVAETPEFLNAFRIRAQTP